MMLTTPEVLRELKMSRTTFWRRVKDGTFPKPFYVSKRMPRWYSEEIHSAIEKQAAKRKMPAMTA
jgi:predicted DNA-binding transcriptional regulator AlpA